MRRWAAPVDHCRGAVPKSVAVLGSGYFWPRYSTVTVRSSSETIGKRVPGERIVSPYGILIFKGWVTVAILLGVGVGIGVGVSAAKGKGIACGVADCSTAAAGAAGPAPSAGSILITG